MQPKQQRFLKTIGLQENQSFELTKVIIKMLIVVSIHTADPNAYVVLIRFIN